MNLEIKFELEDSDLEYFRARFREAREKIGTVDQQKLLQTTRALVEKGLASDPPEFVRRQLRGLNRVATMVEDDAWHLPSEDNDRIVEMLAYFVEPADIIPDDIPGLGLIDDAIAIDLVMRGLHHELEAYEEFSAFRTAESQRRANRGQATDISTEDWLADRRATLHSRMHRRRAEEFSGWRYTLFG